VSFDGGATVGFHNQYNFRGFKAGERAPSLAVDFLIPVSTNSELALNVGEWYINPAEDGTDEFGLYTFLVIPVAGFNFRVGGTFLPSPSATPSPANSVPPSPTLSRITSIWNWLGGAT
jgi:hypothetical protein